RRAFIAADPQAPTMAEMVAAMREGLGRRPNVFPVPAPVLRWMLHASGQDDVYQRASGSLVADPTALMTLGWSPPPATRAGLRGVEARGRVRGEPALALAANGTDGACHCGTVRFRARLTDGLRTARRCTCSYCRMRGAVAVSARVGGIDILAGANAL